MQVETLKDVLNWTRDAHQHLASCMQHCAGENESARAKLLLDYLADHEQKLVKVLDEFQKTANVSALNTWCIEYLDKHPITRHEKCELPFAELSADEINIEVAHQHGQIIELYRYLLSHADIPETQELLEQLLSLEEHEAMQMTQAANRLHDL